MNPLRERSALGRGNAPRIFDDSFEKSLAKFETRRRA